MKCARRRGPRKLFAGKTHELVVRHRWRRWRLRGRLVVLLLLLRLRWHEIPADTERTGRALIEIRTVAIRIFNVARARSRGSLAGQFLTGAARHPCVLFASGSSRTRCILPSRRSARANVPVDGEERDGENSTRSSRFSTEGPLSRGVFATRGGVKNRRAGGYFTESRGGLQRNRAINERHEVAFTKR